MKFEKNGDFKYNLTYAHDLEKKVIELKKQLSYKDKDARICGLNYFNGQIISLVHVNLALQYTISEMRKHPAETLNGQKALLGYLCFDASNSPTFLRDIFNYLDDNTKLVFITNAQFALENMVNRILENLPSMTSCKHFKGAVNKIFEYLEINNKEEKIRILMLPAHIRNTFHTDCIHKMTSYNEPVIINGVEYKLIEGERVDCASWGHLFNLYDKCLDIYQEILLHDKVKKITHIQMT